MKSTPANSAQWKDGKLILHRNPDAASRAFGRWMGEVDSAIMSECDLISDDLPDVPYWDMWDSGTYPIEAARFAIKYARDY